MGFNIPKNKSKQIKTKARSQGYGIGLPFRIRLKWIGLRVKKLLCHSLYDWACTTGYLIKKGDKSDNIHESFQL